MKGRRLIRVPALLLAAALISFSAGAGPDSLALRAPGADSLLPRIAPSPPETKSPGLALLASALLPGAGQVYNESYWKAPVIAGVGVYFTSRWLHYNRLAQEAREKYDASRETDQSGDQRQLQLREFYKSERDTYTWYLLILYILNVADAFVDASLYDFDVGDDLSVRITPEGPARVGVRITF